MKKSSFAAVAVRTPLSQTFIGEGGQLLQQKSPVRQSLDFVGDLIGNIPPVVLYIVVMLFSIQGFVVYAIVRTPNTPEESANIQAYLFSLVITGVMQALLLGISMFVFSSMLDANTTPIERPLPSPHRRTDADQALY